MQGIFFSKMQQQKYLLFGTTDLVPNKNIQKQDAESVACAEQKPTRTQIQIVFVYTIITCIFATLFGNSF